jgi:acyl-CoA synthetase (AMP-forming)/AMP-acid ligase II
MAQPTATIPGGLRDTASALDRSVAERPNDEALVSRFRRYGYRQLDEAINAGAAALAALGVGPGDRVAATVGNHAEIVIAFFAVQRLGAIWVGIARALAPPEKAYQLADSGVRVYLADTAAAAQIAAHRAELPALAHVVAMEPGEAPNAWLRLIDAHAGARRPAIAIDPQAPAGIAYTSGTTGRPKGAVHSQHTMAVVAAATHQGMRGRQWRAGLRQGVTHALTTLNMMILDPVTALAGGGVCICMDRTDAIGIAEWTRAERIEHFVAAPATIFDLLTKPEIDAADLASLKFATSGGANVPDELRQLYAERFGMPLVAGYGLTEAPTAVAENPVDQPLLPGACGRVYAHLKIAALDGEDRELPSGELGEIAIRATDEGEWAGVYTPMLGYWGRPEESAATLRNGWLHTGDIGFVDPDRNLFIKDRLKELIIRGGANIYPAEIERVLTADPRVRGAAVVGKPDPRLGEIVVAFVETADGIAADDGLREALKDACARELARYKIPDVWEFVPEMPRNTMSKIVKAELRARVRQMSEA